jgi:hypothetical protein
MELVHGRRLSETRVLSVEIVDLGQSADANTNLQLNTA